MARKQRTEGQARRSFVKMCAFVGLILAAFLFIFGGLFSGSTFGSIMDIIAKLALLVAVAFPSYEFSKGCRKGWRIVYWIALVIYIVGCTLGLLSGIGIINIGK